MTDPSREPVVLPERRRLLFAALALAIALPAAACGRRPETLRPPEGAEDDAQETDSGTDAPTQADDRPSGAG